MNKYLCKLTKVMFIEAEDEEEARDEFMHKFDLGSDEVEVKCVGKAPTEFEKRAMRSYGESCYLDQGITQGIV